MTETIYEENFCREKCVLYRKIIMRVEGYNMPELTEQQKQKIRPYCKEICSHKKEEFIEWKKTKKLSPLVKKLFGL